MIRKLSIAWGPSPSLLALAALSAPRARGRSPSLVHDELRRELRRAVAAVEPTLSEVATCLAWLEARGVVHAQGVAVSAEKPMGPCLRGGELHLDLAGLEASAASEARGIDGKAHCTLYALRAVLRALTQDALFSVTTARAGGRRVALDLALKEVERVAKRQGLRDATPARFASAPRPREEHATSPSESKGSTEAPRVAKAPRARKRRQPDEGFGGLPDDAESSAPPQESPSDPDTPGPDAEFFLRAAGIEAWPCARDALDRARRVVISTLHPDRAGDASAGDFHRAIKGHQELARLLERLPPIAPVSPVSPAVVSEDPPTPAARAPRRPRVPRRTPPSASQGAATTPITQGEVNEWPPRPAAPPRAPERPRDDDAEFFLRESSLAWPCDVGALNAAWSSLSARLRRMTPASVAATGHARASRGFDALLRAVRAAA